MRVYAKNRRAPVVRRVGSTGRGFSLVSAIFLLVILTVLGAAIVNMTTSQQISSGLDVQGARAYQAARAGVEWGLFQRFRNGATCSPTTTTSFALPAGTTLSTFTVTVTCTLTAGAVAALNRYEITSTACNQPTAGGACPNFAGAGPNYVQRAVQVEF